MSGMSIRYAARRTVRLATLDLTRHQQDQTRSPLYIYRRAKDRFLLALAPVSVPRHLDDKRRFRDEMKKNAAVYPQGVNVHLLDHACFDVLETMARHIKARIAAGAVPAKIFECYQGQERERRYTYLCLKRDGWVADILAGRTPVVKTKALAALDTKGAQVARYAPGAAQGPLWWDAQSSPGALGGPRRDAVHNLHQDPRPARTQLRRVEAGRPARTGPSVRVDRGIYGRAVSPFRWPGCPGSRGHSGWSWTGRALTPSSTPSTPYNEQPQRGHVWLPQSPLEVRLAGGCRPTWAP